MFTSSRFAKKSVERVITSAWISTKSPQKGRGCIRSGELVSPDEFPSKLENVQFRDLLDYAELARRNQRRRG